MRESRNLCVNPKPANNTANTWIGNKCDITLGDGMLVTTPDATDGMANQIGNIYASWQSDTLPAGDYVAGVMLNSYSGAGDMPTFQNRILLVTGADGSVLATAAYTGRDRTRYAARFILPTAQQVTMRLYVPMADGQKARYRQVLLMTAGDYDAMIKQCIAWFDGDAAITGWGGVPPLSSAPAFRCACPRLGVCT
ncbi:hypothetical protein BcFMB_09105 [Bifidobacterium choerinum]|uniref:Uncharacterized protein n=2 Tax=Bifidobacterium choerinum TaxID=35760 RepID=A0A2D3D6M1_9BIFI|nr:hypothetical protein BcFMB_09105 [Bifidobacterium choerinum]